MGQLSPYDLMGMLSRPDAIAHIARDADGSPSGFALALVLDDHVSLVDATAESADALARLLDAVVRDVRESGYDGVEPSPFCAVPTQELLHSLVGPGSRRPGHERLSVELVV